MDGCNCLKYRCKLTCTQTHPCRRTIMSREGLFWVYFTWCWLWKFHVQILRWKWDKPIGSWNMGDELLAWQNYWHKMTCGFTYCKCLKKGAHDKAMFYSSHKAFDGSNLPRNGWNACAIYKMGQLNGLAPLNLPTPKVIHNGIDTLQLEHVNCPIFWSVCLYVFLILERIQRFFLKDWCEHKAIFIRTPQNIFIRINTIDVQDKLVLKWQPLTRAHTLARAPNITETILLLI